MLALKIAVFICLAYGWIVFTCCTAGRFRAAPENGKLFLTSFGMVTFVPVLAGGYVYFTA